ncbi:hypothetical protein K457DRAFT_900467 [Linnemannia elongata AG-77]|uniref:Extracellular membrane protein CFEM domain-containing protein n=1 Tax=Linnemannia elongata AG-77 TaxID=1314771 RepID=A0A197JKI6_9FUNG|nr:hypothetical protein K457DRAFT_900467 [Linnemannia elongata AG-77]
MRSSTTTTAIVASALILALATTPTPISASTSATPLNLFNIPNTMCNHCLSAASRRISPTCNITSLNAIEEPEVMTPTEKACFCPLASAHNTTWTQGCVEMTVCNSTEISSLADQLSASKDAICSSGTTGPFGGGVTAPGPGWAGNGANGAFEVSSTTIAVGALFAVVSAATLIL